MKFEKYFCQSSPPPGKNPGYALGQQQMLKLAINTALEDGPQETDSSDEMWKRLHRGVYQAELTS